MRRSTSFGMWISRTSHIIMCDCDSLQDWSNSAIKVVITKSAMSQTMALSNCKLTTSSCFPKQGSSHPNPTHQAARYKTNNTLTNRLPRVQRHVHNNHQSSLKCSLFVAFKSRTHTPSRRMCNPQSYVISGTSASRPLACIFRLVYTLACVIAHGSVKELDQRAYFRCSEATSGRRANCSGRPSEPWIWTTEKANRSQPLRDQTTSTLICSSSPTQTARSRFPSACMSVCLCLRLCISACLSFFLPQVSKSLQVINVCIRVYACMSVCMYVYMFLWTYH